MHTAQLVMPGCGGDDACLKPATAELRQCFAIRHAMLQVVRNALCDGGLALQPAAGASALHSVAADGVHNHKHAHERTPRHAGAAG